MSAHGIRGFLGFEALLLSDDLAMRALSGTIAERTRAALAAGCDMALHCNGNLAEMEAVASAAPELSGRAGARAEAALAARRAPPPLDLAAAPAEFARMMASAAASVARTL